MTAKVFEAALGIASPWPVAKVDFDEAVRTQGMPPALGALHQSPPLVVALLSRLLRVGIGVMHLLKRERDSAHPRKTLVIDSQ